MKKTFLLVLLISMILPSSVSASENLFYYFDNVNGFNSFKKNNSSIDFSTLIFDTGSTVIAKKLFIKSVDKNNKLIKYADNGGLIFLGSAANYTYSTYNSINSKISTSSSISLISPLIVVYDNL